MSASPVMVIVNPSAGGRSSPREWPKIKEQLSAAGLSFEFAFTRAPGHAAEIAARAIDAGRRFLIAVGGDGTVNEVVNAIIQSGKAADVVLGIVPTGTADALSYSLGLGEEYVQACSRIAGRKEVQIDIGAVTCWSRGHRVERFFVNEASVGLSAEIVDSWRSLPVGTGRGNNLPLRTVAGYKAAASHRNRTVRLRVGNDIESGCICSLFVANGQYCADKMLIAPHASLHDGLLDAIIVGDVSMSELMKIRPTLYDGSHVRHPKIREVKAAEIAIESGGPLLVEADGDVVGETPALFRIMPSALNIAA